MFIPCLHDHVCMASMGSHDAYGTIWLCMTLMIMHAWDHMIIKWNPSKWTPLNGRQPLYNGYLIKSQIQLLIPTCITTSWIADASLFRNPGIQMCKHCGKPTSLSADTCTYHLGWEIHRQVQWSISTSSFNVFVKSVYNDCKFIFKVTTR